MIRFVLNAIDLKKKYYMYVCITVIFERFCIEFPLKYYFLFGMQGNYMKTHVQSIKLRSNEYNMSKYLLEDSISLPQCHRETWNHGFCSTHVYFTWIFSYLSIFFYFPYDIYWFAFSYSFFKSYDSFSFEIFFFIKLW